MLKGNIIQKLLVFEKKILRGIFGRTKENQARGIKNNEELDKLIKHENIVNYIKAQRLSWFSHIQRMPEARATKNIFNGIPQPRDQEEDPNIVGRQHHTGLWSNEDKKLVNLCPGQSKVEGCR